VWSFTSSSEIVFRGDDVLIRSNKSLAAESRQAGVFDRDMKFGDMKFGCHYCISESGLAPVAELSLGG